MVVYIFVLIIRLIYYIHIDFRLKLKVNTDIEEGYDLPGSPVFSSKVRNAREKMAENPF